MDLNRIDGTKGPGLDLTKADPSLTPLLAQLPKSYLHLLTLADGMALASGVILYRSAELLERNRTFELETYLPGYVAIGDDSGGKLFLLRSRENSPVLRVGAGALGSVEPDVVADSLESWIDLGCPSDAATESQAEVRFPDIADVYLDVLPDGKLANLLAIKTELGLELGIPQLKQLAQNLPARLASGVPYGKFRKRCDAVNKRLGPCVSLRSK